MNVLVFAPHNDDETIGVGGTIAKLAQTGHCVIVCEVTSGPPTSTSIKVVEEARKAHKILGVAESVFLELPVVDLHLMPTREKNQPFINLVKRVQPTIAFIPHHGDLHTDHATTAESTMVALRPMHAPMLKAIYAYETLSESEWNVPDGAHVFIPNTWCDITDTMNIKLKAMACYETQLRSFPHPRSVEAIEAQAKVRGSTVCVERAEAFIQLRGMLSL
ncbi:PIG-L deacetylase family protein [Hungatella hathewayi]